MTKQYRTVGVFGSTHHSSPIRSSRPDAERDADRFLAGGARVVITLEFEGGFWMLRTPADIVVRDEATL
ncbi:MAG TPA: hypothetical protein VD995_32575 [Azospirillum sp.]|nr:hypothetical protein [Azospirillum sp.]